MDYENIQIKDVESWPEEEIIKLYKSAGWWEDYDDISEIIGIIKNSSLFVVAFDKNTKKTVGMARLLSDGVSDAYIQDVFVLKEYRKRGIGAKLIKFLLDYCKKNHIYWVGLISEPNQKNFYLQIGFKEMKNYTPMKYSGD